MTTGGDNAVDLETQEASIAALMAVTGVSRVLARKFLEETSWDVDKAIKIAKKKH
jgi:NACalpha-BTF3-like transcription factor